MADKWVDKWEVPSSKGDKNYVVSIDGEGNYACSCFHWIYRRKECKHILHVKNNKDYLEGKKDKPNYVLKRVLKPEFRKKTNELYIPLVAFGDPLMMEPTICYYMLKHGYSWNEVKEIRKLKHKEWSARAVIDYVEYHGETCYPEGWYGKKRE